MTISTLENSILLLTNENLLPCTVIFDNYAPQSAESSDSNFYHGSNKLEYICKGGKFQNLIFRRQNFEEF